MPAYVLSGAARNSGCPVLMQDRRSRLRRRAITMQMMGLPGEAGAIRPDRALEALEEGPVVGVGGLEAAPRSLGLAPQRVDVDGGEAALVHDHAAADHDARHRAAVLGVDDLVGGVVHRQPVDVAQVEEDDVGLVAGLEAAD